MQLPHDPITSAAPRVRVAQAEPADASTVRALARELAAHEGSLGELTATEERWAELLAQDDVIVLLALADDAAVGYVSAVRKLHLWSGREIVALDDLFVAEHARGAGIGALLMRSLAQRCPSRPIRWEVEEGNLRAQRFYLGLGANLRRKVIAWWEPSTDSDAPGG